LCRRWKQEQEERLAKKDASEQEAIEELRRQARQELEDLYKHMDEQLDQTRAANKEAQEVFIAERDGDEPGHEWERVSKMCDFGGKGSKCTKDVSRMRSIFLHLKQDPLVR
jgi:clathrin light chain A